MTEFEKAAKEKFESEGWTVLTSGWPDMLLIRGDEIKAVEAKTKEDGFTQGQVQMMNALTKIMDVVTVHEGPGFGTNESKMHVLVWNEEDNHLYRRRANSAR